MNKKRSHDQNAGTKGIDVLTAIRLGDFKSNIKYELYNIVITALDIKQRYFESLFLKHGAQLKYKKETPAQVNPQLHNWLGTVNAKASEETISESTEAVNDIEAVAENKSRTAKTAIL